jgi:hypothetical protein
LFDRALHVAGLFFGGIHGLTQSLSLIAKNEELKREDKRLERPDLDKRFIFHCREFCLPKQPITIKNNLEHVPTKGF